MHFVKHKLVHFYGLFILALKTVSHAANLIRQLKTNFTITNVIFKLFIFMMIWKEMMLDNRATQKPDILHMFNNLQKESTF